MAWQAGDTMTRLADDTQVPVALLSASVPDPDRWPSGFDPFAITDAVVAVARSVFTSGGKILTAAHPTIAPLILQVGDRFPGGEEKRVVLFQSRLFETEIAPATKAMMRRDYVQLVWTPAVKGDRPQPEHGAQSLERMRAAMMEVPIQAAFFIGGMEGVAVEYDLVRARHPDAACFAFARPGGAAADLVVESPLAEQLRKSDLYPWLATQAVEQAFGTSSR